MDLVGLLRLLWERRIALVVGAALAVAVGLLAGNASAPPGPAGGVATMRVLLDTTESQLVNAAPKGADTTAMRAALLADALATDQGMSAVARAMGLPEDQIDILGPSTKLETPPVETPLVMQVLLRASGAARPYAVNLFADGVASPIISIESYAPDQARAAKLAEAALAGLRAVLVARDASQSRGFVLETVSPIATLPVASPSPRRLRMVGGAVVVFMVWSACVILLGARRMRRSDRLAFG